MKLALKLIATLVAGVVLLLIIDGYFAAVSEIEQFDADVTHETRMLARVLAPLVAQVRDTAGSDRARELVGQVDDSVKQRVRWVSVSTVEGQDGTTVASATQLDALRRGQEVTVERNGSIASYVPLSNRASATRDEPADAIEVSQALSFVQEHARATVWRAGWLTAWVALIGALLVALLGVRWVGRPLQQLMAKARRVGSGDLTGPLELGTRDELAQLAGEINTMCEQLAAAQDELRQEVSARIEALEQLRHSDRLSTVGTLAAGVAHELGTPLNVIGGRATLIASHDLPAAEVQASASAIKTHAERMTTIVRQLLDFARRSGAPKEPLDLCELVHDTLGMLHPLKPNGDAQIVVAGDEEPITARGEARQLQQVLSNLIVNALQTTPAGGLVQVTLARERLCPPAAHGGGEDVYVRLSVIDEGEGIAAADVDRVFEPFFTTKDVGAGTGLGLSIAYGIVRDHGGWIAVNSTPGQGSTFSVYLP